MQQQQQPVFNPEGGQMNTPKPPQPQPAYNGAYYVPPPAPHQPYGYRRKRGCFCNFLIGFLSVVVLIGLAVGIFWAIVQPRYPRFYVEGGSIIRSSSSSNSTSNDIGDVKIVLRVRVRNPSKRMGYDYDWIDVEAFASFAKGESLGRVYMPEFYQGHKKTIFLTPAFPSVELDASSDVKDGIRTGKMLKLSVRIWGRVRAKVGHVESRRMRIKVKCNDFSLPVITSSDETDSISSKFASPKSCHVDLDD